MIKKILLASLITGFASQAMANEVSLNQPQFGLTGGLTFGGDDIGGLEYTDGSVNEVGVAGLGSFGASVRTFHTEQILTKFNAKFDWDTAAASNGDATFSRFSIEALGGFKVNEDITLYAGVAYHMSPEYTEEVDSYEGEIILEGTNGLVIEGAYNLDQNSEISLRYVNVEYDVDSYKLDGNVPRQNVYDASHVGIYYTGFFN